MNFRRAEDRRDLFLVGCLVAWIVVMAVVLVRAVTHG